MNYAQVASLWEKAKDPAKGKPIDNNTRIFQRAPNEYRASGRPDYAIRLHNTDIITFKPNGDVILDSGGWRTPTTKNRMSEYAPIRYIRSDRGFWWLHTGTTEVAYADGIRITAKGKVYGAATPTELDQMTKLRKDAHKYAKGFVDALFAGEVPAPSGGDCWACCLKDKHGQPAFSGSDHIVEHIKEKYYVPSLLVNALNLRGSSPAAQQTAHCHMQSEPHLAWEKRRSGFIAKQIEKCIYKYCYQQLGLGA